MFTGIITDIGTLLSRQGGQFAIACHYAPETIELGCSICCSGCCLTVTEFSKAENGETIFKVDVSPETLNVTTLDQWQPGERINLERALKMGDEFGGHIVSGHVDGIATIVAEQQDGNSTRYTLKAPENLMVFLAEKGSVTLNGVSLTINEVTSDTFTICIIPHTKAETTFATSQVGTLMNIEVDLLARYALRANEVRSGQPAQPTKMDKVQ